MLNPFSQLQLQNLSGTRDPAELGPRAPSRAISRGPGARSQGSVLIQTHSEVKERSHALESGLGPRRPAPHHRPPVTPTPVKAPPTRTVAGNQVQEFGTFRRYLGGGGQERPSVGRGLEGPPRVQILRPEPGGAHPAPAGDQGAAASKSESGTPGSTGGRHPAPT